MSRCTVGEDVSLMLRKDTEQWSQSVESLEPLALLELVKASLIRIRCSEEARVITC